MTSSGIQDSIGNSASVPTVKHLLAAQKSLSTTQLTEAVDVSSFISSYPLAFQKVIENIYTYARELLEAVSKAVGEPIKIELHVDLRKRYTSMGREYVLVDDLERKKIRVNEAAIKQIGGGGHSTNVIYVADLLKQGIRPGTQGSFVASWYQSQKTIKVNYDAFSDRSVKNRIFVQMAYLLFELQNASFSREFDFLFDVKNVLPKELFIEALENLEFMTLQKTSHRLDELVTKRLFPASCHLYRVCYPVFSLHYLFQQIKGHSSSYVRTHDDLFGTEKQTAYRGTWNIPLDELDEREKLVIATVLNHHLCALHGEDREENLADLQARIREIISKKDSKTLRPAIRAKYQKVYECLRFFDGEYRKYVREKKPDREIYLFQDEIDYDSSRT